MYTGFSHFLLFFFLNIGLVYKCEYYIIFLNFKDLFSSFFYWQKEDSDKFFWRSQLLNLSQ